MKRRKELGNNPKIAVAGAVGSTREIVRALLDCGMNLVGVAGLSQAKSANVSGYANLSSLAGEGGADYIEFENINDAACVEAVGRWKPDILFIAGLSQLAKEEIMSVARLNIGFHPTMLPKGRGRAPLAWTTYERANGGATFFELGKGADDGDIISQRPIDILPDDHASDVAEKIEASIRILIKAMCDKIKADAFLELEKQDELLATYTGIRRPSDGLIDWKEPAEKVYALIRAASEPHPGAFTHLPDGRRLVVMRAETDDSLKIHRGVPGRVLFSDGRGAVVQTGSFPLRLKKFHIAQTLEVPELKAGSKLGMDCALEIEKLRAQIEKLKGGSE